MSSHSSPAPAAQSALRSLVVIRPRGWRVVGLLFGGLLLLTAIGLQAAAGWRPGPPVVGPEALLGIGALALAWREAARSNQLRLLTSHREALHLAPLGSSLAKGIAAETIPLASVRVYTYWARIFRYGVFTQYHLRLELADGRVLHLAAPPGGPLGESGSAVPLPDLVAQLARWKATPTGA